MAAAREVHLHVPLVVRLEGTNVERGKQILNESDVSVTAADDLDVINWNEVGTAMLQDGIYARKAWLDQAGNADTGTVTPSSVRSPTKRMCAGRSVRG